MSDDKPPFEMGEWITITFPFSKGFAPPGAKVWKCRETPTFNGYDSGSGWTHRKVDSAHFRRATVEELQAEMKRHQRIAATHRTRAENLSKALEDMRRTK